LTRARSTPLPATTLPSADTPQSDVQRLFPNYREVEKEYYARPRFFRFALDRDAPRRARKIPFVRLEPLQRALRVAASALKLMFLHRRAALHAAGLPADLDEINDIFDGDPWPYGVEANRPTLEADGVVHGRSNR